MERLKLGIGSPSVALVVAALTCFAFVVMIPQAASVRYIVGANMGWTNNVNYTIWAQGKHFYTEDWLFFVYDRNQMNVLEVNQTDYENCNSDHPVHNWTTGAGRDVVPLNVSRPFYFISGKGYCYGGMKLAVTVEETPPPPAALPAKNGGASSSSSSFAFIFFGGKIGIPFPAVLAIIIVAAGTWDFFIRV